MTASGAEVGKADVVITAIVALVALSVAAVLLGNCCRVASHCAPVGRQHIYPLSSSRHDTSAGHGHGSRLSMFVLQSSPVERAFVTETRGNGGAACIATACAAAVVHVILVDTTKPEFLHAY